MNITVILALFALTLGGAYAVIAVAFIARMGIMLFDSVTRKFGTFSR